MLPNLAGWGPFLVNNPGCSSGVLFRDPDDGTLEGCAPNDIFMESQLIVIASRLETSRKNSRPLASSSICSTLYDRDVRLFASPPHHLLSHPLSYNVEHGP